MLQVVIIVAILTDLHTLYVICNSVNNVTIVIYKRPVKGGQER